MNLKLGYYPILDMILALRQLYSEHRFKPFTPLLEGINSKIVDNDKNFIDSIGDTTRGWLHIMEKNIEATIKNIVSPEEFILALYKNPTELIQTEDLKYDLRLFAENFSSLWQNYFNSETARNNKIIFEKTIEIDRDISTNGLKDYLLMLTDRITPEDNNCVKVFIKPEHIIDFSKIETAIVMPSIFASRNFTFWYNNNNYVFFISVNSSKPQDLEPSDMLLLKTLALNDKTRLKMLRILSTGNYTTADMANILNMNSSTVSRHFKVFKDASFVDIFTQEGNSIYYSLNLEEIKKFSDMVLKYIKSEE